MAPECLLERKYSQKSDVWAWAVTVWEIYTRHDPYPTLTPVETATRVTQSVNPLRLDPPPRMTEGMTKLFNACLSFHANERPNFDEIYEQMDKLSFFFNISE